MNHKLLKVICFLMLSGGNLKAQESFLKLDSIVVIDREFIPASNGINSGANLYEGIDTAYLSVGINQIAILRSAAMSITQTSNGYYMFSSSSTKIHDSRITLDDFNIFTTLQLAPPTSRAEYTGSYYAIQLESKGFYGVSKNETILTPGQHEIIGYFRSLNMQPQVMYRIELVYYSY